MRKKRFSKTCRRLRRRRHANRSRCFPLSLESADRSVPLNVQTRYRSYFHKYLSLAEPEEGEGDRYIDPFADMTADTANTAYLKNVTYNIRSNGTISIGTMKHHWTVITRVGGEEWSGKTRSVKFR